jgi:hypothetical protein
MKRSMNRWTRILSVTALGASLLATASCDEDALDQVCDSRCADEGVEQGNASITGSAAVDSFFRSVINFKGVAVGVTADIQAELDGIQGSFGISNADLKTSNNNLAAAIKAKLDTTFKQKLVVKAQPAKCEVNASIAADVTAKCQVDAKCEVDPGEASFQCEGKCTVDASVEGKCDAEAEVVCEVSAPEFACMGSCEGTCTATLMAAASCSGTCDGTCSAACEGNTATASGQCKGQCMGMCTGKCELTGMAAVDCKASCNGKCTYKPGMASCDARAKVSCELKAEAKAECSGKCEGEFEPPKADCDASASCEASAKAEAKFQAKCTPPSIDVKWVSTGTVTADVKAQFDFAMADLKVRLPRLTASLKKAELVFAAGGELGDSGADAVSGSLDALGDADVEASVKFRLLTCAPRELKASAGVVSEASTELSSKIKEAQDVTKTFGM